MVDDRNNVWGVDEQSHQLWQRLVSRGFRIEIRLNDPTVFPEIWAMLHAEFIVDKSTEEASDFQHYYSEKPVSNEFPFWIMFEEFLEDLDTLYYESIIPHMSGRTDGKPFDEPDNVPKEHGR